MRRYFITGTDTDCGKTFITCKLLEHFKVNKFKVAAIKPVASGCVQQNGKLLNEDEVLLKSHQEYLALDEVITPWKFNLPVSPHIAALKEGKRLSAEKIANFCNKFGTNCYDYLFVEGAGGLMVPLNDDETWLDFLMISKIPVILVVGMKLGCLNHALMTEHVLKKNKVVCAGWIANCLDDNMLELDANIDSLRKRLVMPMLGKMQYGGRWEFLTNFN